MWKKITTSENQSLEDYLKSMQSSPNFARIQITPAWHPGQQDIDGYIHDEIIRQGHDPRVEEDGGRRIRQMRAAWDYAKQNAHRQPTLEDIQQIASLIEPENNQPGKFRGVNVIVGNHVPPHFQDVPREMEMLSGTVSAVKPHDPTCGGGESRTDYYRTSGYGHSHATPDDFYVAFQDIHPFSDGNGRTGKVIYNWLNQSLDNPVLMPDYFGGGTP